MAIKNTGQNYQVPRIDQPMIDSSGKVTKQWYNYLNTTSTLNISSGTGAPTTRPQRLGQEYLDTTNNKLYKSFGTENVSNWVIIN